MNLFVNKKTNSKTFKTYRLSVWTTANGKEIAIVNMADRHLMNTIKMLKRGHDSLGTDVSDRMKYLPVLENEANKRGLTP